jgi:uncharacterized protein (TIGR01777 family)
MRIIITGGTGLVGKALAADMAADGHEVILLSRDPSKAENLPQGVRVVAWDAKSAEGWSELADGADAIVNLAGENIGSSNLLKIRWTAKRRKRIFNSRINAGNAVVEAVRLAQKKPGVVIQASAVGYYGPHDDKPFDESAPAGGDYLSKVCQEWEDSTKPVEAMGVRRVIVRSGVILSKRGGTLPLQMLPFYFFVGGPIGNGKQGFSWIHLQDEVKAIRCLIENQNTHGAYNLTGPVTVNNAQFGKALGKAMHRPSFFPLPGLFFKLAFGEASTILLDGQLPVPKRLLDAGYKFRFPDPEAALRDLLRK